MVLKTIPVETGTGRVLFTVEPFPSSPDALLPQQETAPVRASRQVCARPAVMIGWAAWVGPVASLQAVAAATRTNRRITEAPSRMGLLWENETAGGSRGPGR